MQRGIAAAGAWAACWPALAAAQGAGPVVEQVDSRSAQGQSGVLVYRLDFFAAASPNNALDMIRRLPGFGLDIGNVDARGLAGGAGNVLIDGQRPSSKNDTLDQVLLRIPAASVDRIELIRGGAPGIDMQGRSVIANVVLRKTATTEKVLETNVYFYRDDYIGPLLRGQYSRREGIKQTEAAFSMTTDRTGNTAHGRRVRTNAAGAVTQRADIDLWDRYRNANLRGSIQRAAGGGRLRINALADYTNFNNSQDITVRFGTGTNDHNEDVTHQWSGELGANWVRPFGARTELTLTALQRLTTVNYDSSSRNSAGASTEFDGNSLASESIFRSTLKFRESDRWAFEGGGEIAYNFLDDRSRYVQNGAAVPLPNASVLVSELRGEAFAQGTFRPSPKLTIEAGSRVELSRIAQSGDTDKSKSFFYPKPRFQLTWLPAKGHQVRFRVEKAIGQLRFNDFTSSTEINLGTVIGGNADLVPQKTLTFEGVYEHRFWNRAAIELTAQHVEIDDVIDVIPLAGGFEAVGNIGHGTLDLGQARISFPFDKLGIPNALLQARFVVQRSSVTDPLTGERRRLSGEIPFGCGVDFNHDLEGGKFSYGFSHGCNIDRYTSYRVREVRMIDNQPFVIVYGQWKPNPRLTVRLDLGNVTNVRNANTRSVYSGARNASPLAFQEQRAIRGGQYLFVQLRHVL